VEMLYRHCFLNVLLGSAIRNVEENNVELKLNRTHLLFLYADDVKPLGFHYNEKKTHKFNDSSKEVGLERDIEKYKYVLLFRHQNTAQNHDIKIANRSIENVTSSSNSVR
jgi:hypothetical protein